MTVFSLLCRLAFWSSLTAVSAYAPAQGFDSNPQNPVNWDFTIPVQRTGNIVAKRYEAGSGGEALATYVCPVGTSNWTRNGVALPAGSEPSFHFNGSNGVANLHGSIQSHEVIRKRIKWINPNDSPPSSVRLRVSARSWYSYPQYQQSGDCGALDNGLGSEHQSEYLSNVSWEATGSQVREYDLNDDEVEIILNQYATVSYEHLTPSRWIAALTGELSVGLDSRTVQIAGAVYEPVSTGNNVTRSYTYSQWSSNAPGGKEYITYNFTYPEYVKSLVPIQYPGTVSNYAVWKIAQRPRLQIEYWGARIEYVPEEVPPFEFSFGGNASTLMDSDERFKWNGQSWTPINFESTMINPYSVFRPAHYYKSSRKVNSNNVVTEVAHSLHLAENSTYYLDLDYNWADGVTGKSQRKIEFVAPLQLIESGIWIKDDRVDATGDYAFMVPTPNETASVTWKKGSWNRASSADLYGVISDIFAQVSDVTDGQASLISGFFAAYASVLHDQLSDEGVSDADIQNDVSKWGYDSGLNRGEWFDGMDNDGDTAIDELDERLIEPTNWNPQVWYWSLRVVPIIWLKPYAVQVYGTSGFESVQVRTDRCFQPQRNSRRIYEFRPTATGGGPGSGGGGGIGGGS